MNEENKNERTSIAVCRLWDDHKPVTLGYIKKPRGISLGETIEQIEDSWDEFIATEPDNDFEFIDYLVKNRHYDVVDFQPMEVHVGG